MAGDPTKAIVIANIELLMKQKFERINVTGFGKFTGISTGGTQRVLDPDTSVSVDILGRIAAKFGLETWQLLAPNLGQALLLSPAELEAVRKIREPQQPKTIKTEHIETKQIASPLSGHGARKKNKVGV
jgi:hypothetical protein